MFGALTAAIWSLVKVSWELVGEVRKHRLATNTNTLAIDHVAASNERLASAIEKLAEPPANVPAFAEWKTGTPVPE